MNKKLMKIGIVLTCAGTVMSLIPILCVVGFIIFCIVGA